MRRLSGAAWAAMTAGGLATLLALAVTMPAAAVPAPRGCQGGRLSGLPPGRPILVVRDPSAVVAVYSGPHGGAGVCAVLRNGASLSTLSSREGRARVPARAIQVFWAGESGSPGFVALFGRVGANVTAVTIDRSRRFAPLHARMAHGWYVALWSGAPHRTHPTTVQITAGSTTRTYSLPPGDRQGVPGCSAPPGQACAVGAVGPGQIVGG